MEEEMQGRGQKNRWRGRGGFRQSVRFLEPALLLLLWGNPGHGYPLLDRLGEFGLAEIDPSVVYRALRDMEDKGWLTSAWDEEQTQGPPRRVYRLTRQGQEALGCWTRDLQETRQIIDGFLDRYSRHMQEET
jgi:PadR family transcriptional regulator PadR